MPGVHTLVVIFAFVTVFLCIVLIIVFLWHCVYGLHYCCKKNEYRCTIKGLLHAQKYPPSCTTRICSVPSIPTRNTVFAKSQQILPAAMDVISKHSAAPLGSEEDGIYPQDSASPCGLYDGLSPRAIKEAKLARRRVQISLLDKRHALEDELCRVQNEWELFELRAEIMMADTQEEAITAVEAEEAGLILPASATTASSTTAPSRPPPGLPVPPVATISAVHTTDTVGSTTDMDNADRDSNSTNSDSTTFDTTCAPDSHLDSVSDISVVVVPRTPLRIPRQPRHAQRATVSTLLPSAARCVSWALVIG